MKWTFIPATLFVLGMVAGCASTGSRDVSRSTDDTNSTLFGGQSASSAVACNSDAAESAVGKTATDSLIETARRQAGAKAVRALRPNDIMTTEYNPQRLNLKLDDQGVVQSVNCG